jgi:hypothetical protein
MKDLKIGIKTVKYGMNEREALRHFGLQIQTFTDKWTVNVLSPAHHNGQRKSIHKQNTRGLLEGPALARRLALKYRIPAINVFYTDMTATDTGVEYDTHTQENPPTTGVDGGALDKNEHREEVLAVEPEQPTGIDA